LVFQRRHAAASAGTGPAACHSQGERAVPTHDHALARSPSVNVIFLAFDAGASGASLDHCADDQGIARRHNVNSTGPAIRTDQGGVRVPVLPALALHLWRYLRFGPRPRKRALETLPDHLLADVGLDSPGYEQPTWERYIHR
jgi:hypothetical protein